jgi:hypothetical protein
MWSNVVQNWAPIHAHVTVEMNSLLEMLLNFSFQMWTRRVTYIMPDSPGSIFFQSVNLQPHIQRGARSSLVVTTFRALILHDRNL